MKLNWGTGIAIFYGAFMLVMIIFVVQSRKVDHSLVMDNYYEEDLKYQEQMNKIANSKALPVDLEITKTNNKRLQFDFPEVNGAITGEVWFYRPNDNTRDFRMPVKPDAEGNLFVNTEKLLPGLWRLKVEWKAGSTEYYKEQEVYL